MTYVHDGKSYVLDEYRCAFKNFLKDELKPDNWKKQMN